MRKNASLPRSLAGTTHFVLTRGISKQVAKPGHGRWRVPSFLGCFQGKFIGYRIEVVLFLAQLVAPPLQPGPVRLPNTAPQQARPKDSPLLDVPTAPGMSPSESSTTETGESVSDWRPEIKGNVPYSASELSDILQSCGKETVQKTLNTCAAAITARLIQDGYVNSRVYSLKTPEPGALEVVLGTIAELQITSDDAALQKQVEDQLYPLIGTVLHLPTLEKALVQVRRRGAGDIKGGMGRLGSDPTKAVVNLTVSPAAPIPLQGEISLGNNGSVGSGEWRAGAVLLQNGLFKRGDTALLFLELTTNDQLKLGGDVISATYTWPLSDTWSLTGSLGYSESNFVDFPSTDDWRFRTLQGLLQLQTDLHDSERLSWTAAAALSANRTDGFDAGRRAPLVPAGGGDGWSRSGSLKLSTNLSGVSGALFWNANAYFSQGIAGITPDDHLNNLAKADVDPGRARAIGSIIDLTWMLDQRTNLNLRAAGQVAFAPLPGSMSFSIGSDTGLRGLPGSLEAGDSGYLGTGEVEWTAWQKDRQSFALIPFVGIGGIHSDGAVGKVEDSIGVTGLIGRYRNGGWEAELGWTETFNADGNLADWNDWVLGSGVHAKIRYSF